MLDSIYKHYDVLTKKVEKGVNPDQLVLIYKVNLITTNFKIRFIGIDHVKIVLEYFYNLYSLM